LAQSNSKFILYFSPFGHWNRTQFVCHGFGNLGREGFGIGDQDCPAGRFYCLLNCSLNTAASNEARSLAELALQL
jgi:hypothetical protein